MKLSILLPAAALAAAPLLALPATAAEIQIPVQGPVVELTVTETSETAPDLAQVGAGVSTRGQSASEAARLNAQQMDRVIARLRELGIPREDIQTSNFNLNPQWHHRNEVEPVFNGYIVTNQVNVKLRDMTRIGTVFDALIAAGANSLYGPNFMVENDRAAKTAARRAAYASAEARARELAGLAGYSAVRLLEVSETYETRRPMHAREMMVTANVSSDAATQIEPGRVAVDATLTVKYEMAR
jgi:uncharacterized protein